MADATEARLVESMYDELQQTGRVEIMLSEDERTVRYFYRNEVLSDREQTRSAERARRRIEAPEPQGHQPVAASGQAMPITQSARADNQNRASVPLVEPSAAAVAAQPGPTLVELPTARVFLQPHDEVVAAPSIGPKTAARLEKAGVRTVGDLLRSDPQALADALNVRHITPAALVDWQDQARLVMEIPGLRGTHAQLFVGAGLRTTQDIAAADPTDAMAAILKFAGTGEGQRVLRDGSAPDFERIKSWVEAAERAIAA